MNCPAEYRFGLAGTMPGEPIEVARICAATDREILYQSTNEELISEGWSAFPTIELQPLQYMPNYGSYYQAYDSMIRYNKSYAKIVADEVENWHRDGKTTLVIVDRIAQGRDIENFLRCKDIKVYFLHGNLSGDFRADIFQKMRDGRVSVVIASSIVDEGIDIPAIQVLVLAAGGKTWGRQLQRVGRALRRKSGENRVTIIDFIHNGNRYLEEHSLGRVELYKQQGFEVKWRTILAVA